MLVGQGVEGNHVLRTEWDLVLVVTMAGKVVRSPGSTAGYAKEHTQSMVDSETKPVQEWVGDEVRLGALQGDPWPSNGGMAVSLQ